tara:strand:+ start:2025 stop:2258 length:234 start_codon:yes stop_codon:yes gene_type:complete
MKTRDEQLVDVMEGILDSSAREFLEYNKTKKGIDEYAENGMGILLTDEEIDQIFKAIDLALRLEKLKTKQKKEVKTK